MVNPAEEVPTASVRDLPGDPVLLDVREDDEWAAGHAPVAKHIPLGELPARLDELAELPDDQPLYVVCRTGGRSARATMWLNANGWDAVNVAGGMKSWQTEGRELVGDRPGAEPEVL
ncbi:rhodanese-like domain-containing protein [Amycolatopsis suaedae]|uniref:Rhodanese-like domain-containing protein n=1 Tax=Amycolatopsis suaedae TaxID=2510978 RepID=A0A4Q7J3P1_9PSEU|nr:rhodanese-like domain-containing protein [Amycolatopsis suaedae]RZQ62120.1 rhodanese-like domain-containing protein [Amycolatopsis suaedae]